MSLCGGDGDFVEGGPGSPFGGGFSSGQGVRGVIGRWRCVGADRCR
ncbi:hypothetical protein MKSMC1_04510 [Mycobacterium kansasii]|nr:hypothetical protein MKSMC1_04510 [Mycobacterium kansasii]